jgi:hypothetical protein
MLHALGHRTASPVPADAKADDPVQAPCEVCAEKRTAYLALLRNGGSMQGWDIRPNLPRGEVT